MKCNSETDAEVQLLSHSVNTVLINVTYLDYNDYFVFLDDEYWDANTWGRRSDGDIDNDGKMMISRVSLGLESQ